MCSVVIQDADVTLPEWVNDLASFSRWMESEEFPEEGRIDYLAGEIWIDMSEEKVWTHNQVKTEFTRVLSNIAKTTGLGRFFQDGLRIQHPEADLSAVPDGAYILNQTFQNMRAVLSPGANGEDLRVEGSPDMVLEVISNSSVQKDTGRLRKLYSEAGIPEYWLVDARKEPLSFDILRCTAKGYVQTRKQDGWIKSALFSKAFRLLQDADELDHPTFTLEVR